MLVTDIHDEAIFVKKGDIFIDAIFKKCIFFVLIKLILICYGQKKGIELDITHVLRLTAAVVLREKKSYISLRAKKWTQNR